MRLDGADQLLVLAELRRSELRLESRADQRESGQNGNQMIDVLSFTSLTRRLNNIRRSCSGFHSVHPLKSRVNHEFKFFKIIKSYALTADGFNSAMTFSMYSSSPMTIPRRRRLPVQASAPVVTVQNDEVVKVVTVIAVVVLTMVMV